MSSFNKVILIGNLARDPELRYTQGGHAVCNFAIAVNEKWTAKDGSKKEEVGFFDVTCWGKLAELTAEYLKKGRKALVEGKLKQEKWEDKEGGKRSKVIVNAENVRFLGSKGSSDEKEPVNADEEVGL